MWRARSRRSRRTAPGGGPLRGQRRGRRAPPRIWGRKGQRIHGDDRLLGRPADVYKVRLRARPAPGRAAPRPLAARTRISSSGSPAPDASRRRGRSPAARRPVEVARLDREDPRARVRQSGWYFLECSSRPRAPGKYSLRFRKRSSAALRQQLVRSDLADLPRGISDDDRPRRERLG